MNQRKPTYLIIFIILYILFKVILSNPEHFTPVVLEIGKFITSFTFVGIVYFGFKYFNYFPKNRITEIVLITMTFLSIEVVNYLIGGNFDFITACGIVIGGLFIFLFGKKK